MNNMSALKYNHLRTRRIIFFGSLMLGLLLSSLVLGQEECTQLLTKRCETCHYMTRVCQKVDKERNKKSWFGGSPGTGTWKRTIKNMVKQGAQLNKAEENILVECLSKPSPEVLSLCKLDK